MWVPEPAAVQVIVETVTVFLGSSTFGVIFYAGGKRGVMVHLAKSQHQDYESLSSTLNLLLSTSDTSDAAARRRKADNFIDASVLAARLNERRESVRVSLERVHTFMVLVLVSAAVVSALARLAPKDTGQWVALFGVVWAALTLWLVAQAIPLMRLAWERGLPVGENSEQDTSRPAAIPEFSPSSVVPMGDAAKSPVGGEHKQGS